MLKTINTRYKDLKNIIQRLNFSLLTYPETKSVLAETHLVDDNKNIWCWSEESFSGIINGYFPVTLKFIDRVKGNYIRISGKAFVEDQAKQVVTDTEADNKQSLLRIEMMQVVWYYKKTGKVKFYSC